MLSPAGKFRESQGMLMDMLDFTRCNWQPLLLAIHGISIWSVVMNGENAARNSLHGLGFIKIQRGFSTMWVYIWYVDFCYIVDIA